jgi:hypothetical protein
VLSDEGRICWLREVSCLLVDEIDANEVCKRIAGGVGELLASLQCYLEGPLGVGKALPCATGITSVSR